jgi:methyl-coenzyme M reductase alpha subunit
MFLDAMKKKFAEDPTSNKTTYKREGYIQSKDKKEFQEWGAKIAKERGIPAYNVNVHLGGMTLGQRQLMPYNVSGTDVMCEGDDLHYVNNPAMQQMWDEIRRTVIVGLDTAHETLTRRLGKEVTPETINGYLEALNHTMPGAAIVQEHMVETHPGLVEDCFVKVYTGDDDLASEIDKAFLIDINKMFPSKQAEQLKKAIGKTLWQAVHIPTIVSRTCDGGNTSRWSAMQIGMSFIAAYNMCAGEAAVADLAFAAKHASLVEMANFLPARRARGPNEPGGLSFGFLADIVQTNRSTLTTQSSHRSRSSLQAVCSTTRYGSDHTCQAASALRSTPLRRTPTTSSTTTATTATTTRRSTAEMARRPRRWTS